MDTEYWQSWFDREYWKGQAWKDLAFWIFLHIICRPSSWAVGLAWPMASFGAFPSKEGREMVVGVIILVAAVRVLVPIEDAIARWWREHKHRNLNPNQGPPIDGKWSNPRIDPFGPPQ